MKDNYAFPRVTQLGPRPGMELRDWFAGMALQGILAHHGVGDDLRALCAASLMAAEDMMEMRQSDDLDNLIEELVKQERESLREKLSEMLSEVKEQN